MGLAKPRQLVIVLRSRPLPSHNHFFEKLTEVRSTIVADITSNYF
ncbi:hypothetical protein [Microcoleus sp.]